MCSCVARALARLWWASTVVVALRLGFVVGFGIGLAPGVAPEARAAGGSISLVSQLPMPDTSIRESDVTGWVDPVTLKEYAAVGQFPNNKVFIIDCSNPASPTIVATILAPGFDLKYWNGFLYLVTGDESAPARIYNVTNPASPTLFTNFRSGHNIFITDDGFMYKEVEGLKIYDLNQVTGFPIKIFDDQTAGGHDATVVGNRLYDFHGGGYTAIYDVTNPATPVLLSYVGDPTISYHHSGWTDASENYLYVNDEIAFSPNDDFSVWDISNVSSPVRVNGYNDPDATIHNSYRVGDFLYCSYYVAGFRVFDLTDPANPVLADEYDTSAFTGEGSFEGAWGCYPFQPSGNIYVSDEQSGFWIFRFDPSPTGVPQEPMSSKRITLAQNFPNPFNPATTISYTLERAGHVSLAIFSVGGKRVRELVNNHQSAGRQTIQWDARDDAGKVVSSGTYFYRLHANGGELTRRMVLVK